MFFQLLDLTAKNADGPIWHLAKTLSDGTTTNAGNRLPTNVLLHATVTPQMAVPIDFPDL